MSPGTLWFSGGIHRESHKKTPQELGRPRSAASDQAGGKTPNRESEAPDRCGTQEEGTTSTAAASHPFALPDALDLATGLLDEI